MEAKDKLKELCKKIEIYMQEDSYYSDCVISGHPAERFDKLIASLDKQIESGKEIFTAKSGRKYRSIPDDMDIETWDAMTIVQRIEYKGLLRKESVFTGKEIPAGAEEMYPADFALWFRNEALLPIDTDEKSGFIVMALRDDSSTEPQEIFTLQELFQYWNEQIIGTITTQDLRDIDEARDAYYNRKKLFER